MLENILSDLLKTDNIMPALPIIETKRLSEKVLNRLTDMEVFPRSIAAKDRSVYFLGLRNSRKYIGIVTSKTNTCAKFEGESKAESIGNLELTVTVGPTSSMNAAILRDILPFLKPRIIGLKKSAGCGDRLGMATPGHIRAVRKTSIAPVFAQQSIRENERTRRTPQIVMDDAMWGVFQEGWRDGFGADADHLKTTEDIDSCVVAGFTFFTIDPGDHVDNSADNASPNLLPDKAKALPWSTLESSPEDMKHALVGKPVDLGSFSITLDQEDVLKAAVKYGRVVAHTVSMYRHLMDVISPRDFELEVSVDETDSVTSLAEHIYIASELKRLGIRWVSLAPRYLGTFEKGVDYIGDLSAFEKSFSRHVSVAKTFGPYKLSLHSGSDKFSIYPVVSEHAEELVHLKTAGTSYLEALRTIAGYNTPLFREIVFFALGRYHVDRASYHVSAEIEKMPDVVKMSDESLPELLDDFHSREILHVTYGSVINEPGIRADFFETLNSHEEEYSNILEKHFDRHFSFF